MGVDVGAGGAGAGDGRCVQGAYLQLHWNRALLNILAERLDVGMAVDFGQTVMHLVAVLLDRRAVRSVLDRCELLQDIG